LCNINLNKRQNIVVDDKTAISCCTDCLRRIYDCIKLDPNQFDVLQDILLKKIEDRYRAPLLFDKDVNLLKEMLPRINSTKVIHAATFNKCAMHYGKNQPINMFFFKSAKNMVGKFPKKETPFSWYTTPPPTRYTIKSHRRIM